MAFSNVSVPGIDVASECAADGSRAAMRKRRQLGESRSNQRGTVFASGRGTLPIPPKASENRLLKHCCVWGKWPQEPSSRSGLAYLNLGCSATLWFSYPFAKGTAMNLVAKPRGKMRLDDGK